MNLLPSCEQSISEHSCVGVETFAISGPYASSMFSVFEEPPLHCTLLIVDEVSLHPHLHLQSFVFVMLAMLTDLKWNLR